MLPEDSFPEHPLNNGLLRKRDNESSRLRRERERERESDDNPIKRSFSTKAFSLDAKQGFSYLQ
jgi:hypothetical protein